MTRQTRQEAGGVTPKMLLDSVASILEANAARQALDDVREYLDPVLRAARLQQKNPTASSQRLAKSHSTFVVNLLRVSLAKIASEQAPALQTAYIELASLGLEGLSVLRSSLKGRPHEVEVQRYMLIRKLVSLACHQQALQQSCLLYSALCCQCWHTGRTAAIVMTHSITYRTQPLPRPDDSNSEICNLVVGSVLNMLLSVVEQSEIQRNLSKVMIVVHDYKCITQWLSILPEADKAKHSDTLFRYLFKAANQALSLKQQDFVEDGIEICKCAVQACLQSSSHLRLPQVVEKYIQQLPSSDKAELLAHALEVVNTSGAVQAATLAINTVQACMSAVSHHPESLKACLALLSSHQQRHGGDRWLSILSVPATALLLKPSGGDGSNAHAWAENLLKANATIKELLQQLQSRRSGKKPARSATAATDKAEAGSSEIANLCQLAHAVLLAISSLRKTVQASAMQAPYSGCKADENQAAEEEPRDSLCTCLMLAAPLASVVVSLQSQLLPAEDPPQCNAADRLSYPALSGLVTACQIKSAVAIQDSARTVEVCSADAFEPFWSPAAWGQHQVPPLPLKAAEERWASSALFSCAVQLHSSNSPQSAETLFAAACDAAASSLCKVMLDGSQAAQPETQAQIQSFVRKNQALANALHQQGRIPAALNVLGNALKLLASLGMAFIKCGQPLVLALVTLRAGLHSGPVLKVASKPSSRGHRQRKVMHNMQADAAGALPADAPVAAYLDQLPQPVSSVALGEALAMEAKAVHEVLLEGLLPHSSAVKQGRSLLKQLGKVWSAQEQPVLHARALLLQARLSGLLTAPETAQDLTQQAIDLLADQQDDGTADVLATAHAMRALLHAQQLRQAGAERETSQPFTSSGQREGWRQCLQHVLSALQTWQQSRHSGDRVQGGMHTEDGTLWGDFTASELILELLFMSGLHGEVNLQTMASQLLKQEAKDLHSDAVLHSLRTTPGSPLVSWSLAPQPVAAVLSADPSCRGCEHSLANAHEQCRPDFGSSAENDQSSAADLQQMAHELAASKQGRSAVVVWNRALLHQLAGQAYYQDGQMTSALYNASEALRLGSTLFSSLSPDRAAAVTDLAQPSALPSSSSHQTRPSGAPPQPSRRSPHAPDAVQDSIPDPDTTQAENTTLAVEAGPTEVAVVHGGLRGEVGVDGVGYWQVTWLYLTSLLKLGEAYEVAGSHEDALHAFREGQELAKRCGAERLSDVFSVHIAEVLLKTQAWVPYQQELDHLQRQVTTGNAQSSDSISGWMIASVSRLQGLQAQHDHCHQAACTYFESAVTQLVSSLESVQDPGRCWLLQGLLCKARLAQAESCLYMGNNAAAADLTQAAMSDISSGSPCPKRKKGSRNCRESRPSSSSPPVTRRHHSFEHARALHMQAKIRAACSSPMASDCITLAGCDASLAQRQHSNAEASTSAPERLQGTGRSSRAAKSARGGRGTTTGSSTRAKAATAHVKDEYCHAKQCAEESDEEDLLQQAQLLLQAYQLSQGAPLLAREVARDLSKCCSKLGLVHAAVLLEHASLGASVSLQYRGILHSKLQALERRHLCGSATPEAEQASAAITRAVAALEAGLSCNTPSQSDAGVTHAKEALQAIEDQASADLSTLASHLPPNVTITSLSIACTTSTNTSSASSQASRWHLTITRYQGADPPILMVIPVPSHSFLNPSDRGAEDEAPMALNHQARAAALEEFDSIMTDSASSMKSDAPLVTSANKTAWWRKRLELDQRMAALLQHLDEEWLGPWKVLLYGTPSDSTLALTLQEAADGFLSELSKQIHGQSTRKGTKQAQPTLKALMTALMWGAASLTARQLQVAARELLRLAGISSDDEAVDQLSQQIRSRYNDACGSSMSQAGSTADHSKLASTALRETTNVAPVAKRGSSRVTVKAMAPATEVAKPKAKGKTVNRALQTTGKQASRPSRFATMQSAATAAPAHRSPPVTDLTTPTSAAPSGHPQDPALVSQLQARFDALALEEEQGQEKPVQSRPNNGDDGGWVGRVLDHQSSLLVLDGELQTMPWESLPSLKQLRIYRAPSLACAAAVAARQPSAAEDSSADAAREVTAVNMASTVYMVNPAGDLSTTQATFEETFRQQHTWQGTAGEPMAPGPLAAALQGHDMFLYFGHGSGDQYLSARALRRMPRCASALLMGCSSGSLAKAGQYEPSGPVLAYLMAGCPVAIANLWDVTDRDIDRFSKEVLSKWIELVPEEGSSGQHDMVQQSVCVSASVAMSRKACRLAALIGAAPVCYGIPVAVSVAQCHGNHQ